LSKKGTFGILLVGVKSKMTETDQSLVQHRNNETSILRTDNGGSDEYSKTTQSIRSYYVTNENESVSKEIDQQSQKSPGDSKQSEHHCLTGEKFPTLDIRNQNSELVKQQHNFSLVSSPTDTKRGVVNDDASKISSSNQISTCNITKDIPNVNNTNNMNNNNNNNEKSAKIEEQRNSANVQLPKLDSGFYFAYFLTPFDPDVAPSEPQSNASSRRNSECEALNSSLSSDLTIGSPHSGDSPNESINLKPQCSGIFAHLWKNKEVKSAVEVSQLHTVKENGHSLRNAQVISNERGVMFKGDLGEPKDWNEEFQRCVDMPQNTPEEKLQRWIEIAKIAQNFEHTAQVFGKIIIAEVFLPRRYRTIKPFVNIGGNAGGEKYIYNGILFKFATDWKKIYGGDEYAMKAANHEMNSLMKVMDCQIPGIRVPLMTLIDYLGYRLVAVSLLPISDNTLVYGSSNGGLSVHADEDEANRLMEELGKKLNLRGHVASPSKEGSKFIYMPADIEGHRGRDGRFYLIDFARIMPPATPEPSLPSSFLFRLLRPEFVEKYPKPLSSDAFSKFDQWEPNREEHKRDIRKATKCLLEKEIPMFLPKLMRIFNEETEPNEIIELMHRCGINLRYLAIVRRQTLNGYLRYVFLLEMVARGIKNHFREVLRNAKRTKKVLALQPYREVILEECLTILGNTEATRDRSVAFWNHLHEKLRIAFPSFPTAEELLNERKDLNDLAGVALFRGECPTAVLGETFFTILSYECNTCGLTDPQGVCYACMIQCHRPKGHRLSKGRFRTGFHCDCKDNETCKWNDIQTKRNYFDTETLKECPLKFAVAQLGWVKLYRRIETIAGIKFSTAALKELENNESEFVFVLPDIEKLTLQKKQITTVTLAEAHALHLKAMQLGSDHKERHRLFQQSLILFEKSIKTNPGSRDLQNLYAQVCEEQALSFDPKKVHIPTIEKALTIYTTNKDVQSVKELIVKLHRSGKKVDKFVWQTCFDLLMRYVTKEENVNFIAEYGDHLEILRLETCPFLNDITMLKLAQRCHNLTSVSFHYCHKMRDAGLISLVNCCSENLREIVLDGIETITDLSVQYIIQNCTNLTTLGLSCCTRLTNASVTSLSKLTSLTHLDLSYTSITDMPSVCLPSLKLLKLRQCDVTDLLAQSLIRCHDLKVINLGHCSKLRDITWFLIQLIRYCPYLLIVTFDGLTFTIDERLTLAVATCFRPPKKRFPYISVNQATTNDESLRRLRELGFRLLNSVHVIIKDKPNPNNWNNDTNSQTILNPFVPHTL